MTRCVGKSKEEKVRLKYLELYGFKSFAEKTRLNFDSDFIGIVGPNGSGKSNVSDAIRWVLGEQSAKALRGASMSDVIFAGNRKKGPMNMAEVAIVFDNGDGSLPLPYEEVVISRRVYRSGESEYRINKELVRRRDIRDLFLDTGIGKEGYSIIGQGRIDDILSSNSEDRRRLFEEAAHIAKYKQEKLEASNRLEKTGENLDHFVKEVQVKEKEEKLLAQQADNARRGMQLTQRLNQCELSLLHKRLEDLEADRSKEEASQEKDQLDLQEVQAALQALEAQLAPQQEAVRTYANQKAALQKQLDRLQPQIAESEKRLSVLQEQRKFYQENQDRLTQEQAQLQERLAGAEKERAAAQTSLQGLQVQTAELSQALASLPAAGGNDMAPLRDKLDQLKADRDQAQSRLVYLDFQKEAFDQEAEAEKKRQAEGQAQREAAQAQLATKEAKLEALEASLQQAEIDREALTKALDQDKAQAADKASQADRLRKQLTRQAGDLEGLKSRYRVLEDLARSYEGYGYAVQQLLRAASENRDLAQHMRGSLAGLIRVKEGYETAINAALGGSLQNIVTDSQADAKYLINWLKSHHLGRVTFLPLQSIRGDRPIYSQEPEEICNGVDAVTYPKDLEGIVSHFLARTTIVQDLDQAIALSRKGCRNRIVSLDGEVINAWGSMVGGQLKQRKDSQILNRQDNLDRLAQAIQESQKIQREANDQLESLEADLASLQEQAGQQEGARASLDQTIQEAREQLAGLRTEIRLERETLQELEASLQTSKSFDLAQYTTEKAKLQASLAAWDQEIQQGEAALKDQEAQDQEGDKQRALLQNQLDYTQREVSLAENRLADLDERLEADRNRLSLVQKEADQVQAQMAANLAEAEDRKAKLQGWQADLVTCQDRAQTMDRENAGLEAQIQAWTEEKRKLDQAQEEGDRALYAHQLRLQTLEEKRTEVFSDYCSRYDLSLEELQQRLAVLEPVQTSKKEVNDLRQALSQIGFFRYEAIEEDQELKEELAFLRRQIADLSRSKMDIESMIRELDQTMETLFTAAFQQISTAFDAIFKVLFNGGKASLQLDSADPLSAGIEIQAQPPGKQLQSLDLLSGGERSMTALALLFAIFSIHPTPFCILDEIDANLDEANIGRYVRYLQTLKEETQFIVITHRKTTMELADMIYGLTMEEGISKTYALRFEDYQLAAEEAGAPSRP